MGPTHGNLPYPYNGKNNYFDDEKTNREIGEINKKAGKHQGSSPTRSSSTTPTPAHDEDETLGVIAASFQEQERRFPPVSVNDRAKIKNNKLVSVHDTTILFNDDEILEMSSIVKIQAIGIIKRFATTNLLDVHSFNETVYARYTEHEKAIIQQQSTDYCIGTIVAMLMMDNGKMPDIARLESTIKGDEKTIIREIRAVELNGEQKNAKDLLSLKDSIRDYGCAVVSTKVELVPFIIVDEISADLSKVRIRDPYHGWEITVSSEAFQEQWIPGKIIQIPLGG